MLDSNSRLCKSLTMLQSAHGQMTLRRRFLIGALIVVLFAALMAAGAHVHCADGDGSISQCSLCLLSAELVATVVLLVLLLQAGEAFIRERLVEERPSIRTGFCFAYCVRPPPYL